MEKVTDTTKKPRPDWSMGGNPDAIETQESEGQKEITAPSKEHGAIQLPLRVNGGNKSYEDYGIKFVKKVDDLFGLYRVPSGWKTKSTDHPMWNELVNNKGLVVASFFYKAAFYDRDAFINFE